MFDVTSSIEIMRIIDENIDGFGVAFKWNRRVFFQIVHTNIFEQLRIDHRPFAVWNVGTVVKLAEGGAQIRALNLILFDQNGFEIFKIFRSFPKSLIQLGLGNPIVDSK
jgi:hypothetical protein